MAIVEFRGLQIFHSSVLRRFNLAGQPMAVIEPNVGGADTAWSVPDMGALAPAAPLELLRSRPVDAGVVAARNVGDADVLALSILLDQARPLAGLLLHGASAGPDDTIRVKAWSDANRTDLLWGGSWFDWRAALWSTSELPWEHPNVISGRESPEEAAEEPAVLAVTWGGHLGVRRIDVEFDCRWNAADTFRLGMVSLCESISPVMDFGGRLRLVPANPDDLETEGGVEWPDEDAATLRVADVDLPDLGRADALQSLWRVLRRHGSGRELVVSLWPDDATTRQRTTFVARIEDAGGIGWLPGGLYPSSLTFRELL